RCGRRGSCRWSPAGADRAAATNAPALWAACLAAHCSRRPREAGAAACCEGGAPRLRRRSARRRRFGRSLFRRLGGGSGLGGRIAGFLGLGGLFGVGLALLARHRLLGIAARLALGDAGLVEEAHDAVGRLRALLHPRLHLLEVELEALFLVLRQQRIVIAEPLDEAAVARRARVGEDDMIEWALLGAGARHADDERHLIVPF